MAENGTICGENRPYEQYVNMTRQRNSIYGNYRTDVHECYMENGRQYINATTEVPVSPPVGTYFTVAFVPTPPKANIFMNGCIINGNVVMTTVFIIKTDKTINAYIPEGTIAGAAYRYTCNYVADL